MLTISERCYWIWAASYAAKWLVLTHAVMWLSRQIITPLPTMSDALLSIYVSPNMFVCKKIVVLLLPPLVVDQSHHPWSSIIPAINSYVVPPFFFVHSYVLKLCVPISLWNEASYLICWLFALCSTITLAGGIGRFILQMDVGI